MEFVKDACEVKKEQQCASCENGWLALHDGQNSLPFPG